MARMNRFPVWLAGHYPRLRLVKRSDPPTRPGRRNLAGSESVLATAPARLANFIELGELILAED